MLVRPLVLYQFLFRVIDIAVRLRTIDIVIVTIDIGVVFVVRRCRMCEDLRDSRDAFHWPYYQVGFVGRCSEYQAKLSQSCCILVRVLSADTTVTGSVRIESEV